MLAGQCDAGKALFRRAVATTKGGEIPPDRIDQITETEGAMYCTGNKLSERDQYLRAIADLNKGGLGTQTKTAAECQSALDVFLKLRTSVKPKDESDTMIPAKPLIAVGFAAPMCFAKAGDCAAAYRTFKAMDAAKGPGDGYKFKDSDKEKEKHMRKGFESLVPICKGK